MESTYSKELLAPREALVYKKVDLIALIVLLYANLYEKIKM